MDTDQLIAHSRARFAHESAKRVLKEKYQAKMIFAYAGGMWRAGPELLTILNACPDRKSAVILSGNERGRNYGYSTMKNMQLMTKIHSGY